VTRDLTVPAYVADAQEIRRIAGLCLKRAPLHKKLRLLGVRMGALLSAEESTKNKQNQPPASVKHAGTASNLGAADSLTGQLF
jgi:DNA polymerase IV